MIEDLTTLCGREIACSCGRVHTCPIGGIAVGEGVLAQLPALLAHYRRVFLAADTNTYPLCGARVEELLGERLAGRHVFQRAGKLVPDEAASAELDAVLPHDCDMILGIGSGVINDLCKYAAFGRGIDSGIVATAPSMDGFASSGAAMITAGMKVTYTVAPPRYIVADVDILRNAPEDMIRAGYGDIIGKYSSLCDWKLAHLIRGEHMCGTIYAMVKEATDRIRDRAAAIMARDAEAIGELTRALILIGITLSHLGSTRPGSGSEHHLSHFFEIVGLVRGEDHFCHGIDVGYATVLTAAMREEIASRETPVFRTEDREAREAAWRHIYGPIAGEVAALQAEAGSYDRDLTGLYAEKWDAIRAILRECPTADECRDMLLAAGFDMDAPEAMYGAEKIADAMRYGKDLKDRYSMLWIHYALFSGAEADR